MAANGYKLSVDGKMIVEGATVALKSRWPDYVFEKNYNLMPLTELKKFVKEKRHLPEVPSSTEIRKTGIDTGEMSTLLIKKTEELTLYFIALDERLKKLETERSATDSTDPEK